MKRPAQLSLGAAAVVVVLTVVGVLARDSRAEAPVQPAAAGLTGEVWVMPGHAVPGFLKLHHAPELRRAPGNGLTVVGRVSWTGRPARDDERYTILLGDGGGGAGYVDEVLGLNDEEVSLGTGSMWNETTRSQEWLRGDRPMRVDSGSWTTYGSFASVRTSVAQWVWCVGHVVEVPEWPQPSVTSASPAPVIGVALSTGDKVWWLRRVTSA